MNTENNTETTSTVTVENTNPNPVTTPAVVNKPKAKAKTKNAKVTKAVKKTPAKATKATKVVKSPKAKGPHYSKNGKLLGRPPGATGNLLVSLESLVKSLPATAQIPVSMKFIKLAGLKVDSAPFRSTVKNLTEISQAYKTTATVVDLNMPETVS